MAADASPGRGKAPDERLGGVHLELHLLRLVLRVQGLLRDHRGTCMGMGAAARQASPTSKTCRHAETQTHRYTCTHAHIHILSALRSRVHRAISLHGEGAPGQPHRALHHTMTVCAPPSGGGRRAATAAHNKTTPSSTPKIASKHQPAPLPTRLLGLPLRLHLEFVIGVGECCEARRRGVLAQPPAGA